MNNKQRKLPKHNQEVGQRLACSDFQVTAPFSRGRAVTGGVGSFSHPNFGGRVDLKWAEMSSKSAFFFQMVTTFLTKYLSYLG